MSAFRPRVRACMHGLPIHYGYVIFVVATIGKIFTAPGQSPCIGVFIGEISAGLNMTSTTISGLYLVATTSSAVLLPLTGRGIDTYGTQCMVLFVSVGLSIGCFVLAAARTNVQVLLGFFLLRYFGQGALMNVCACAINYWWVEVRGKMMGIAGAIRSAVMLGIVPGVMIYLVKLYGWRTTYGILGLAELAFMAPFGFCFLLGKPEEFGFAADAKYGGAAGVVVADGQSRSGKAQGGNEEDGGWATNSVLRTPAFWCFSLADFVLAATGTGYFFHLRAMYEETGLGSKQVVSVYPAIALCSILGGLSSGFLIDRIGQRLVLVIGLGVLSVGFVLVPLLHPELRPLYYLVGGLIGIGTAYGSSIRSTVYASYFGKKNLGSIQTIASALTVLGSAVGPFPFGYAKDQLGSYKVPLLGSALCMMITALLVFVFGAKPIALPQKKSSSLEIAYTRVNSSDVEAA